MLTFVAKLVLVIVATKCGGHSLMTTINPENGTVVTRLINDTNVTFECLVVNPNGEQVLTQWFIQDFLGVEGLLDIINAVPETMFDGPPNPSPIFLTFHNFLTFPVFLEDFDGATLTCGTPQNDLSSGQFPLRVYRVPPLQNLTAPIRFPEGEIGLEVTPEVGPTAHPFPSFEWTASEGITIQNDSRRTFGYPSLMIDDVRRSDSGLYSLTATNRFLEEPMDVFGSGAGSFTLDVLYGPEITRGPRERAVRVDEPLQLLCGSDLDSNPLATITWRDPARQVVADNARYDLIQDAEGTVRLDFTNTITGDMGTWTCEIRVEGTNVTQSDGGIVANRLIGSVVSFDIMLYIVVAPGEPQNLTVDSIGATWANLCWQEPQQVGQPGIDFYTIYAQDMASGDNVTMSTYDNSTRFNMTGLLPDVTYEFRVFAVAMALDVQNPSMPSERATGTTTITVPAPVCNIASPDSGGIYINWKLIHTGGRPLTSLSVSYIFMQGGTNMTRNGPMVELSDVSASIPSLVAGYSYFPRVTAANIQGSTTVECPRVDLNVGIPQDPEEPQVVVLGGGRVAVTVRTLTSGLESGGSFYFILTLTQTNIASGDQDTEVIRRDIADYSSGDEFTFNLDLVVGDLYTFDVVAGNEFGMSGISSTSKPILSDGTSSGNAGAVAGGVIGALIGVFIIVAIVVLLVFFLVLRPRRHSYKPAITESRDELNVEEGGSSGVRVEEIPPETAAVVDIGQDLSKKPEPKELHYAELESFRSPPTVEKKEEIQSPKSETHKPVEYATIDSFRKAPSVEEKSVPAPADNNNTSVV